MRYIDMPGWMKGEVQKRDQAKWNAAIRKNPEPLKLQAQRHATEFVLLYAQRECNGDLTGRLTRRMGVEKAECEALVKKLADAGVEFSPIYSIA